MFTMRFQAGDQTKVLRLHGCLRRPEVGVVREAIERMAAQGCSRIVLDLGGVQHADFRALRVLFQAADRLERRGGALRTANMRHYLRQVFSLAYTGEGEGLLDALDVRSLDVAKG